MDMPSGTVGALIDKNEGPLTFGAALRFLFHGTHAYAPSPQIMSMRSTSEPQYGQPSTQMWST